MNIIYRSVEMNVFTDQWSLMSILKMSPESEGSVEDLGTVTTHSALNTELQLLPVHPVHLLQVVQHLLAHDVFEDEEAVSLGTFMISLELLVVLELCGVILEQVGH